jgi:hypothetical protein
MLCVFGHRYLVLNRAGVIKTAHKQAQILFLDSEHVALQREPKGTKTTNASKRSSRWVYGVGMISFSCSWSGGRWLYGVGKINYIFCSWSGGRATAWDNCPEYHQLIMARRV